VARTGAPPTRTKLAAGLGLAWPNAANDGLREALAQKMAQRSCDVAGKFSKTALGSNGLEWQVSRTLDGRQRQEQSKRRVGQGNEAVMPVKSRSHLVLGVHHQGEGSNLRTGSAHERIG